MQYFIVGLHDIENVIFFACFKIILECLFKEMENYPHETISWYNDVCNNCNVNISKNICVL